MLFWFWVYVYYRLFPHCKFATFGPPQGALRLQKGARWLHFLENSLSPVAINEFVEEIRR